MMYPVIIEYRITNVQAGKKLNRIQKDWGQFCHFHPLWNWNIVLFEAYQILQEFESKGQNKSSIQNFKMSMSQQRHSLSRKNHGRKKIMWSYAYLWRYSKAGAAAAAAPPLPPLLKKEWISIVMGMNFINSGNKSSMLNHASEPSKRPIGVRRHVCVWNFKCHIYTVTQEAWNSSKLSQVCGHCFQLKHQFPCLTWGDQ